MAARPLRKLELTTLAKLPADEKLRRLLGASLKQALEIMSWDVELLPPYKLNVWNSVRHDIWNLAFRAGLEDRRSAERDRVLKALIKDYSANLSSLSQVDQGSTTSGGGAPPPGSAS